jgi:acetyl/propionyl-CoA carboxylase alpha subunit
MSRFLFKTSDGASPIEVELRTGEGAAPNQFEAALAGQSVLVEIETGRGDMGTLRLGARVLPFCVAVDRRTIHVWLDGQAYQFELADRSGRRGRSEATAALFDLTAPMPGTVLKVNVRAGDAFEAHEPLVVMESMKMEMSLSAPRAAKVKEVTCREGQLVEMGAVLVKFEETDDDAAA